MGEDPKSIWNLNRKIQLSLRNKHMIRQTWRKNKTKKKESFSTEIVGETAQSLPVKYLSPKCRTICSEVTR